MNPDPWANPWAACTIECSCGAVTEAYTVSENTGGPVAVTECPDCGADLDPYEEPYQPGW